MDRASINGRRSGKTWQTAIQSAPTPELRDILLRCSKADNPFDELDRISTEMIKNAGRIDQSEIQAAKTHRFSKLSFPHD